MQSLFFLREFVTQLNVNREVGEVLGQVRRHGCGLEAPGEEIWGWARSNRRRNGLHMEQGRGDYVVPIARHWQLQLARDVCYWLCSGGWG